MWLARDRNNNLWLHKTKPISYEDRKLLYPFATFTTGIIYRLNKTLFPEVTFENSPVEVELKIK